MQFLLSFLLAEYVFKVVDRDQRAAASSVGGIFSSELLKDACLTANKYA